MALPLLWQVMWASLAVILILLGAVLLALQRNRADAQAAAEKKVEEPWHPRRQLLHEYVLRPHRLSAVACKEVRAHLGDTGCADCDLHYRRLLMGWSSALTPLRTLRTLITAAGGRDFKMELEPGENPAEASFLIITRGELKLAVGHHPDWPRTNPPQRFSVSRLCSGEAVPKHASADAPLRMLEAYEKVLAARPPEVGIVMEDHA